MNTRPSMVEMTSMLCLSFLFWGCGGGGDGGGGGNSTQPKLMLGPSVQYSITSLSLGNAPMLGKTVIGDLNGDRLNDVAAIVHNVSPAVILIYYQKASGEFDTPLILPLDVSVLTTVHSIDIGDLNNDGKLDLVVSGDSSAIVVYYQEPSTGKLLPGQLHTVSSIAIGDLKIADVNSDGRNDVVMITHNGLSIFYQNPDGSLGSENIYDHVFIMIESEIHVADMDNDGDNDIVLQSGNLQIAIIKQESSTVPGTLSDTPEIYSVKTSYWPQFYTFEVGDLNNDGLNDVIVVDPGNNGFLNIFLQNNQGTLDLPVLVTVPGPPYGVEIADINGDGLNDILGDRVDPGFPPVGNILTFYQGTDHTFRDSISFTFSTTSGGGSVEHESLSVGDVTGDGRPDAVVTWADDGLYVLPSVLKIN